MSPDYAAKLLALRRAKDLLLKDAAAQIGVRSQTLKENEDGTHHPYEPTRLKYGAFYGVDPDTLEPIQAPRSDSTDPGLHVGRDGSTVQPSPNAAQDIPEDRDGDDQEQSMKDLLYRIYQGLGPKGPLWLKRGLMDANLDDDEQLPVLPGKSTAGGG